MSEIGATRLTPPPESGRMFTANRRVRLSDVSPQGLARLDAVARYLQDIARDDSADAAIGNPMAWVVRRTLIEVECAPRFQEMLELATWCSGFGGRWAERRTRIRGDSGAAVETASIWVHIDSDTGRARRLDEEFHSVWGEAAAGRRVSARRLLDGVPGSGAIRVRWSARAADLDVMRHMNNAAHWAAVVEATERLGAAPARLRAELEHVAAIGPEDDAVLWACGAAGGADVWMTVDGSVATAARVRPLVPAALG